MQGADVKEKIIDFALAPQKEALKLEKEIVDKKQEIQCKKG